MTRIPLLLGHRGCRSCGFVENSTTAFEFALAQGCDGLEFDVRRTRDGRNVLWHDPDYHGRDIAATDSSELLDSRGSPLARLDDVLQHFGHTAYLDIELKVPGTEESVMAALRANPPQKGYVVTSFYPEVLQRVHDLDSSVPLGFLFDRRAGLGAWLEFPVQVVLPRQDFVTSQLIDEVHQSGRQIITWTVNDPARMLQFAAWGIDGIISDDPALLYQTFHSD